MAKGVKLCHLLPSEAIPFSRNSPIPRGARTREACRVHAARRGRSVGYMQHGKGVRPCHLCRLRKPSTPGRGCLSGLWGFGSVGYMQEAARVGAWRPSRLAILREKGSGAGGPPLKNLDRGGLQP
ncbi:unnamed protein product [Amoebophrya sp. A25]|nr:unnamed protein product [Amoebophrya sp. A25]|eukprot:GSA25T00001840001.1